MPHRIKAVLKAKGGQTQYKYGVPNNPLDECIWQNRPARLLLLLILYRDLLLPIQTPFTLLWHARHATAQIAYITLPTADLYRWSWGRWRVSEEL